MPTVYNYQRSQYEKLDFIYYWKVYVIHVNSIQKGHSYLINSDKVTKNIVRYVKYLIANYTKVFNLKLCSTRIY